MIWTEIKLARNPSYFVEKASERLKTIFLNLSRLSKFELKKLETKSVVKCIDSKFLYIYLRIFEQKCL